MTPTDPLPRTGRPQLHLRGVVEGFYGEPWSHAERVEFLGFAARVGLNTYLYAPKDDPYHRDRWRERYPDAALQRLRELAAAATRHGVRLIYALAPGLSMRFSEEAEHRALAAKAQQLWQAGIRSFALLFDDVPTVLTASEDIARFGADAQGIGAAHGLACAEFASRFLVRNRIAEPVLMCPTDYAGCAPSPYRTGLGRTLPADALVLWTGPDIVVGEVSRADIDAAAASYGRDLVLWDNFPVNDFDRTRLFLGPLQGRSTNVAGSALRGILANPMVQAAPSRFALATVADWAWDPLGYDPAESARRALALVAGPDAAALAPLVAACSSWPPSAPQSARFAALAERSLAGEAAALDELEICLGRLAATGIADPATADALALAAGLEPWIAAARSAGRAGVLACRLLRRLETDGSHAFSLQSEGLRVAQAAAELHYANILRSILPRFVSRVLDRASADRARRRARITVLIGADPGPGDRELRQRLSARGFEVTSSSRIETRETLESADLVIVTRTASVTAARVAVTGAVPILAWGHLEAIGLARESAVTLSRDSIEISDPASPLAARLSGPIRVYRGTGKITWGEPSPDGRVIARAIDHAHPVIVFYPAGAELPDGSLAPAARVTTFLGEAGLAPWLMSDAGRALVAASVEQLIAEGAAAALPTVGTAPSRMLRSGVR